jgi:hypothetical protein
MSLNDWWAEKCKCSHSRFIHKMSYMKFYECNGHNVEEKKHCECQKFELHD